MSIVEEKFDRIVREAINEIDRVNCSIGEYQSGLRAAIEEFEVSLSASIECDGEQ